MAKSPWGSDDDSRGSQNGSGSDGGRRPPNIEDLAGQFQDSLKKMFPGGGGASLPGGKKPSVYLSLLQLLYG